VIRRFHDSLDQYRAELVRRQRGIVATYPQREKRSESSREAEGDREIVRRDVCPADEGWIKIVVPNIGGTELEPELQGEVHAAGIVGLPIRPHQVRSQMERPGGGISADAAIVHRRDVARRPGMHHALQVTREERQVQRLIDLSPVTLIGKERMWIRIDILSPGASPHCSGSGGTPRAPSMPKRASRLRLPRTAPAMTSATSPMAVLQ
jgi:hypothetical protein